VRIWWSKKWKIGPGRRRWLIGSAVAGVVLGAVVVVGLAYNARYRIAAAEAKLLGAVSVKTADIRRSGAGFSYNGAKATKAEVVKQAVAAAGPADSTGKAAYAAELPRNLQQGMKFGDGKGDLSFTMVPQFGTNGGRESGGRVVYPEGGGQRHVYTFKRNGIKEDILLGRAPSATTQHYSWKLELGDKLEAKLLPDGSVGMYSANQYLYGSLQVADEKSQKLVDNARKSGQKDSLVFVLPRPFMVDASGKKNYEDVSYELKGDVLTLEARNLRHQRYPLSIDPTIAVTTTADFRTGADDGMIDYGTANQINRSAVNNGVAGVYTTNTNYFTTPRFAAGALAYNGYLYVVGGSKNAAGAACSQTSGKYCDDIMYAAISSNGSVGTWTTNSVHLANGRAFLSAFAYNGYLYVVGGELETASAACKGGGAGSQVYCNDVVYGAINPADGSVGALSTSSNYFTTPRSALTGVAYNGYIYVSGGAKGTSDTACKDSGTSVYCNDTQYAAINADGSTGVFAATSYFSNPRSEHAAVAYNGWLYIVGGNNATSGTQCKNSGTSVYCNDVQYAQVKADGTLGTFTTNTNYFGTPRSGLSAAAAGGFLYISGGNIGSASTACKDSGSTVACNDTQYAAINADGTVNTFATNQNYVATNRYRQSSLVYGSYLYVLGGEKDVSTNALCRNGGAGNGIECNDVQYAPIADWCNDTSGITCTTSWSARRKITFNNSASTTNLVNFPVLVKLDSSRIDYSKTQNSGQDLRFVDPADPTTVLPHEVELWNESGTSYVWVKVPKIDAGSTTDYIWMYYGNASASDGSDPTNAWDSSFQGVWHLKDGTTLSAADSKNAFNGTNSNATATLGQVDGAANFNGTTARISIPEFVTTPTTIGSFSMSWWVKLNSLPAATKEAGMFVTDGNNHGCTVGSNGHVWCYAEGVNQANWNWDTNYVLATGSWVHMEYTYDGTNRYLYINGNQQTTTPTTGTLSNPNADAYYLGWWQFSGNGDFLNGALDEARYSNATRSGDWVKAEYLTETDAMNTFSAENPTVAYGTLGSFATNANYFTLARFHQSSVAYNGYLYVLGGTELNTDTSCKNTGLADSLCNDVQYAQINADGSVGAFANTSYFATPRTRFAAVAYNGYLYVIGGNKTGSTTACVNTAATTDCNDIQYAAIGANGTLGAFTVNTNYFSFPRADFAAAAYNGYLYIIGGNEVPTDTNCKNSGTSNVCNDVQYAQFNSNGSVGTFTTNTNYFSIPRYLLSATAYNGYLYVAGGFEPTSDTNCKNAAASNACNDVQVALINANGSVGTFANTSYFNFPRYATVAVAADGYFYIAGGNEINSDTNCKSTGTSAECNDVQSAQINANGTLGSFASNGNFTTARDSHSTAFYDGKLYIIGGFESASNTSCKNSGTSNVCNDVQYAGVKSPAQQGRYERVIDLGVAGTLATLGFNGSACSAYLTYRTAPATGAFGSATTIGAAAGAMKTISAGNTRYVWVKLMLDDQTCGAQSVVTDIDATYFVPPDAPTLISPVGGVTGVGLQPELRLLTTDQDGDYVQYKIEVCSTSNCSSVVRTIDQTASQTGWLSQGAQSGTAYTSGQTAIHQYQLPALNPSTQYWWRAYAIDPGGTNTFGVVSAIATFTTGSGVTSKVMVKGGTTIKGGTKLGQ
jgi:hypothetical protein